MIRRSVADPTEVAYFLVHAPPATATNTMVAVAGIRWRIEECNEQSKDLIGLDQHQVRTWTAFHHHVAVAMFAHAFAATRKAALHTAVPAGQGAHRGNDPATNPPPPRQPDTTSGGHRPPSPTSSPCSAPGSNPPATASPPSAGPCGNRPTAYEPRSATTSGEANESPLTFESEQPQQVPLDPQL